MTVTCAVCGRSVDPGGDHVEIKVTKSRVRSRDILDDYYLHERCAGAVLEGWREP